MSRWKIIDLTGEKIGRLTVLKYHGKDKHNHKLWECICSCGNTVIATTSNLRGTTTSCGCYNADRIKTHGESSTRRYQIWADMKDRCDNPNNPEYAEYGGRGITYCSEWKAYEGFMLTSPEGYDDTLTLDRRDTDGNYCPENCRWATMSTQNHNRRKRDGCKSVYIGVVQFNKRWHARIRKHGENLHIGTYATEIDAARAYDDASEEIYGDRPNKTARE